MLTRADEYPIHQTPDPIAFAGTDRNFYDRYFFNGHSPDGQVFFGAAMGIYPHLNIIDAAFSVRIGDRQYNLRASRHLNMERMDTHVGPIRVEVVEPLKSLRVVVEDNEHGISADLLFEGRHFPFEEARTLKRIGPRTLQDVTRMTQMGRYTGTIRAGGQDIAFPAESPALGVRDRSWGVRPIGERDPQAHVPAQELQVWWYWLPVHFDDGVMLFLLNEDGEGKAWNQGLLTCRDNGPDGGEAVHLPAPRLEVTLKPGTREPVGARLEGDGFVLEVRPGANFYMSALGYWHPDWGHGKNRGGLAIGYDEIDTTAPAEPGPASAHIQAFAEVTLIPDQGPAKTGVGCFEHIIVGRHAPSGLTSAFGVP